MLRFPNLGGGGNSSAGNIENKTASYQWGILNNGSGGRKRFRESGTMETGGNPMKVFKTDQLPGQLPE